MNLIIFLVMSLHAAINVSDQAFDLVKRDLVTLTAIDSLHYEGVSSTSYTQVLGEVKNLDKIVGAKPVRFLMEVDGAYLAKNSLYLTEGENFIYAHKVTSDGYLQKFLYALPYKLAVVEVETLGGLKKGSRVCTIEYPRQTFKTRVKVAHLYPNEMVEVLVDRSFGTGSDTKLFLTHRSFLKNCQ